MRGRDRKLAFILAAKLVCDPLQVADLDERATRGRDDDRAGRRKLGEPLALADEDFDAELVLELADLLADSRLRRVERFRGVRDVEAVIDDRAEVFELLEVQ